jgi:circadian clock protein KaiB
MSGAGPAGERYRFRLYVLGGHVGAARAEPDLRDALRAWIGDRFDLEVIDVRARPDLAEADRVLAAPTVIRLSPGPLRRAVGNMADARAVASALGLEEAGGA